MRFVLHAAGAQAGRTGEEGVPAMILGRGWLLAVMVLGAVLGAGFEKRAAANSAAAATPEPALVSLPRNCPGSTRDSQQLATISNTRDHEVDCLGLSLDRNAEIKAITFAKHLAPRAGSPEASDSASFARAAVASERGAVLDGTPGHDAVILQGRIEAGDVPSVLVVRYLHNGITGEFRQCEVRLQRDAHAVWHLTDAWNQPVSRIVVKTWALPIIGTAGIDTLQGICSAS